MKNITPCLWFDNDAEEAVKFYVSIFKNSKIGATSRHSEESVKVSGQPAGSVLTIAFTLNGQDFMALNGGPQFKFTEAISFMVNCETQKEIDEYWQKLSEGGSESQCGWLKDRYGMSWQIVPSALGELINGKKAKNVMKALLQMKKLDIEVLKEAGQP